ncbi:MAG: septum formation initiator family protein [Flavobacteriales bacterium]|nr:septum formation initiator family protein [Flavobacteriales bacterium]
MEMTRLLQIKTFFSNRYRLAGLLFAVWCFFIADVDVFRMVKTQGELKAMENEIAYHELEIALLNEKLELIAADRSHLERYAREAYYMCRSDEDVYLIH